MNYILESVSTGEVLSKLKDVKAGAFAVKVVYKSPLPVSKVAIKNNADIHQEGCYKIVTRLGRIKVNWYNTKARKEMTAQGHIETHQPPKGFRGPEDPEEEGLLYYSINSGKPYLILQQGGIQNGTSAKFYINGNEVQFSDVEDAVNQGLLTKAAAVPVENRDYQLISLENIQDLIVKAQGEQVNNESISLDENEEITTTKLH